MKPSRDKRATYVFSHLGCASGCPLGILLCSLGSNFNGVGDILKSYEDRHKAHLGRNQTIIISIEDSENEFCLQRSEFNQIKTTSNSQKFLSRNGRLLFLLGRVNNGLVNSIKGARAVRSCSARKGLEQKENLLDNVEEGQENRVSYLVRLANRFQVLHQVRGEAVLVTLGHDSLKNVGKFSWGDVRSLPVFGMNLGTFHERLT
jgi:hypothetical protein